MVLLNWPPPDQNRRQFLPSQRLTNIRAGILPRSWPEARAAYRHLAAQTRI